MFKGTKLYSIFAGRCPKCHEGTFFKTSNPYDLKQFDKINDHCEHCGEPFMKEPGFYIGSMYISYALSVGFIVVAFMLFVVYLGLDIYPVLYALIPVLLLLLPVFFRLARIIWLNIFVSYDPQRAQAARRSVEEKRG